MSEDTTERPVAVIGAGTLGRRIALMFATRGGEVRVFDASTEQREDARGYIEHKLPSTVQEIEGGSAGTVTPCAELAAAVEGTWLVIEAVPERLDLKREIFAELDRLAPTDAILASNSSSYPSSRFVDDVGHRERVVNMHFYMPPGTPAVEIMSCGETDPAVMDVLMERTPAYGLVPFRAQRESTGFIYNRIWAAIKREALAVVAEGVSTPQDVDRIFALCLGAPYGPFRMMDAVGLDVALDIEEHYAGERDGLPEGPRRVLREYIDQGRLGRKSGRGFYDDYRG